MSGRNFLTHEQTHQLLTDVLRGDVQIVRPGEVPERNRKGWVTPKPDGTGWNANWTAPEGFWVCELFPEDGKDTNPQVWGVPLGRDHHRRTMGKRILAGLGFKDPAEREQPTGTQSLKSVVDELASKAGIKPGNETGKRVTDQQISVTPGDFQRIGDHLYQCCMNGAGQVYLQPVASEWPHAPIEPEKQPNENFSRIMSGLHEIAASVGADKPREA